MIHDWSWSLQWSVEVGIWVSRPNLRVGYNPLGPPLDPPPVTPPSIFSSNELFFKKIGDIFSKTSLFV
jgi:hypothetical protein